MTDDRVLISRLAGGDQAALETLLERHWESAYRVALRFTKDPASAEDSAQEAFVNVLKHAGDFDPTRGFSSWFFRIVENAAKKQLRARRRRRHHEGHVARGEVTEDREAVFEVHEHLERLGPKHREALTLHYLYGLTFQEVAESLGIPVGTVASRMRRGLEALQGSMKPAFGLSSAVILALLQEAEGALPPPPSPEALLGQAAGPPTPPAPPAEALMTGATKGTGLWVSALALVALLAGGVGAAIVLTKSDPSPVRVGSEGQTPEASLRHLEKRETPPRSSRRVEGERRPRPREVSRTEQPQTSPAVGSLFLRPADPRLSGWSWSCAWSTRQARRCEAPW
ncbi:MAG: sigma-70 family RNA polymerase sigma factor [Planctomycetes bacterium]|nr:sigma-70 family RNA polymerase sigma factor [Planctomycetota bacterium]